MARITIRVLSAAPATAALTAAGRGVGAKPSTNHFLTVGDK